jgi:hypothetical protein
MKGVMRLHPTRISEQLLECHHDGERAWDAFKTSAHSVILRRVVDEVRVQGDKKEVKERVYRNLSTFTLTHQLFNKHLILIPRHLLKT